MLFNSIEFVILLLITFTVFYLSNSVFKKSGSIQISILIIASFIFYSWELPILIFLLLISVIVNSFIARRFLLTWDNKSHGNFLLIGIGVVFNLLVLFFFKYSKLLLSIFIHDPENILLQTASKIPLPIGISFYTFQGISLIVDLYRHKQQGLSSIRDVNILNNRFAFYSRIFLYISFFPQLIAGPIVKAHDFVDQIKVKRLKNIEWQVVVENLLRGYFFKMVIADNLKESTSYINSELVLSMGSITLWLLIFAYSIQIFADFSGYSYIAIGLGALFGYKLPKNFNFPYISSSFAEFWTRWHISLSSWLKEYLYFALGGNRKGISRTYINLFLVMFLGGLWHGAGWNYALWGTSHGILLAIERLIFKDKIKVKWQGKITKFLQPLRSLIVFILVSLLWLLFVMDDYNHAYKYLTSLFSIDFNVNLPILFSVITFSSFILFYYLWHVFKCRYEFRYKKHKLIYNCIESFSYAIALILIIVNSGNQGDFIYFQF